MRLFLLGFFFTASQTLCAQATPVGLWLMIDDKSGDPRNEIEIYEKNNKLYGKVVKQLHPGSIHNCDLCTDYRKGKPMLGMIIIEDLEHRNGYWKNGRVLFPKQGKWYDLEVWLMPGDPNTLALRGYWGPIYRTQYWKRIR